MNIHYVQREMQVQQHLEMKNLFGLGCRPARRWRQLLEGARWK